MLGSSRGAGEAIARVSKLSFRARLFGFAASNTGSSISRCSRLVGCQSGTARSLPHQGQQLPRHPQPTLAHLSCIYRIHNTIESCPRSSPKAYEALIMGDGVEAVRTAGILGSSHPKNKLKEGLGHKHPNRKQPISHAVELHPACFHFGLHDLQQSIQPRPSCLVVR